MAGAQMILHMHNYHGEFMYTFLGIRTADDTFTDICYKIDSTDDTHVFTPMINPYDCYFPGDTFLYFPCQYILEREIGLALKHPKLVMKIRKNNDVCSIMNPPVQYRYSLDLSLTFDHDEEMSKRVPRFEEKKNCVKLSSSFLFFESKKNTFRKSAYIARCVKASSFLKSTEMQNDLVENFKKMLDKLMTENHEKYYASDPVYEATFDGKSLVFSEQKPRKKLDLSY